MIFIGDDLVQRHGTMDFGSQIREPSAMPRTTTVEFVPTDPRPQNAATTRRRRAQPTESERSGLEPLYSDEQREPQNLAHHNL
jgi:hypothetical protein